MSYELKISVSYDDTGYNLKLKQKTILQYFQNIAILHSKSLGYDTERYEKEKVAWVLNKLYFEVYDLPEYGDEIIVKTWSMGIKGFKGTRRFEILKNDKSVISGVSLWLYIDTERKRLKKVPENTVKDYEETDEKYLSHSLDFPKIKDFEMENSFNPDLRISDFDNNMHLNNIAYIDILDTILYYNIKNYKGFRNLNINYTKEIALGEKNTKLGVKFDNDFVRFKFFKDDFSFAVGNCKIIKGD